MFVKLDLIDNTNLAEIKLSPGFNGLITVLENDIPHSIQLLNVIQITLTKRHSPTRLEDMEFWSYTNDRASGKDDNIMGQFQRRNWNDPTHPLFIVVFIRTKYKSFKPPNIKKPHRAFTLIYCRDHPTRDVMNEFATLFDWSYDHTFSSVDMKMVPYLEDLGKSRGCSLKNFPDTIVYLPKDKWASLIIKRSNSKVPEVTVKKLLEEHALIVNNSWKFGDQGTEGSLQQIKDAIKYSTSAGVYIAKNQRDNGNNAEDDEELASWMISLPLGTLNALHTPEKHRRKGYAELTLLEACAQSIENGIFPMCEIEPESSASKALCQKFGLIFAYEACWVECAANNSQ